MNRLKYSLFLRLKIDQEPKFVEFSFKIHVKKLKQAVNELFYARKLWIFEIKLIGFYYFFESFLIRINIYELLIVENKIKNAQISKLNNLVGTN